MALFTYKVIDPSGRKIEGEIEAEGRERLVENFQKQGFIVVSVKQNSKRKSLFSSAFFSPKIKTKDLLIIFSQLAAMLEAGIPLIDALESLVEEIENKNLKKILTAIAQSVSQGETFAGALAKVQLFDPLVITLVKTGEASGHLDLSLQQLVVYLEELHELKQRIKSALTYPVFLIFFATAAVIFLLTKIVPIFAKIYARFKVDLPLPTRILLHISDSICENIFIILVFLIGMISLFFLLRNKKLFRFYLDQFKLRLPLIGSIVKKTILTRFATAFSILIRSGIPVLSALRLAKEVVQNKAIEMALNEVILSVEKGDTLANAMKKTKVFPGLMIQMAATGEKTGMLDEMFKKVARFYDEQVKMATKNLTTMIEPIMIIFLGIVVGFILLSVFLPIFKLGQVVRG